MRVLLVLVSGLLLTACSAGAAPQARAPAATSTPPELPDMGPAPELENDVWLNTQQPLRLSELRGQVVLLEMWTFGCVNCQRVIPYIRDWYQTYREQGLVVIGNHYPEFSYEEDLPNLKDALKRWEIEYPVAQDNDGRTWRAYSNRYWPTLYLIDKRGHLRYVHIGEGRYEETEAAIRELLTEPGA
ncbi:MAG: redoxin domain-containing protein [Anaerolineales bacterium]|jgi:thiol-disulfide isomerase/thioredoxin